MAFDKLHVCDFWGRSLISVLFFGTYSSEDIFCRFKRQNSAAEQNVPRSLNFCFFFF